MRGRATPFLLRDFEERVATLSANSVLRSTRAQEVGVLMLELIRKRGRWTVDAMSSLLNGDHGNELRHSAWTSVLDGMRPRIFAGHSIIWLDPVAFSVQCMRSKRLDMVRAVLAASRPSEFDELLPMVASSTTAAGRLLDHTTCVRVRNVVDAGTTRLDDRFLLALRREIKSEQPELRREWVAFFVPLDPVHPDIDALAKTSLGPFLMEASMRERISAARVEAPTPALNAGSRRARATL